MDIYYELGLFLSNMRNGEHGFPRKGNCDGDRVFTENLFFVSLLFLYHVHVLSFKNII